MIIAEQVKDLVVVGEDTSKRAKISGDKLAKLQYLLTKGLYRDPITAVIAEWTNNGVDAVVQAGKNPIESPVLVKINKNSSGQHCFSVEDKGTGLDNHDFENICMNYLESTKEDDNDTIGHFGIGMKSFLSLERSATFTCRKNGVERKYLVYEGAEFVNYDLIYMQETTEENGVLAELMINNWDEGQNFIRKAKAKLAYYDTAVLLIDNVMIKNDIYRNELFQWSTLNQNSSMHLSLKDVYYTIDYEALGIRPISIPIAIKLSLGDGLTPTPSRESYITNERTKELLISKIREISDWFIDRYNETVKEFPSFMDSFDYLGMTSYMVRVSSGEFVINPLIPYSTKPLLAISVKGIKVRNPNDYKIRRTSLLTEYTGVGYMNYTGIMKTKEGRLGKTKDYHILVEKKKTVLVGDSFRGNIKDFLKEKYGKETLYVRRNNFTRKLGSSKELQGHECYKSILDLTIKPRTVWREHIKEWDFVVSTIVSTFVDEINVEDTKEYQDWLEKKREDQKELRRLKGPGPKATGLNKQVGDVTIGYSYRGLRGISFRKQTKKIQNLDKERVVTLVLDQDDIDNRMKDIILGFDRQKYLRFAVVGKKEVKKIPEHYQFINLKQFMSIDCKPFMRVASSIVFEKALGELIKVKGYKNGIFQNFLKSLAIDELTLEKYVDDNLGSMDENTKGYITDVATEHKLFDLSLWDVYTRIKEGTKKYDFIHLLQEPPAYNVEMQKRYESLITQILLFRKKYYNDLPEGTRIIFEETVATV